jgi:phage N-6-adenine-methyltransferase
MTSHQLLMGDWAVNPHDCWATPQKLFDEIDREGLFTVDVCAEAGSAKSPNYWTIHDDGLSQDWSKHRVYCNPPYSNIEPWVEKCRTAELACLLVPVASDSGWFHKAIWFATVIDFFRGRINFIPPDGITASSCNGRHCLIWFDRSFEGVFKIRSRDAKTGKLLGL